jgi:hypothetical protein
MRTRTRALTLVAAAAGMLATTTLPAAASHAHYIVTPGGCVEDVASGQTSKGADEPAGHVFHDKVHHRHGSNGTSLADLTGGRVTVYKAADFVGDGPAVHLRGLCGLDD